MSNSSILGSHDADLEALLRASQPHDDHALAARYAPIIRFDENEPFLPLAAGYTVFRQDSPSRSFPREIKLNRPSEWAAEYVIEYAIWWDWDISHLYELEHVWVFVDVQGQVIRGEASWHGGYHCMTDDGLQTIEGNHLVIFSEPGKHAFAPDPQWFIDRRPARAARDQSTRRAGVGGVWVTPLFESQLSPLRTPFANTLARTYLQRCAFSPARRYTRRFPLTAELLVPWDALEAWIPTRVAKVIDRLSVELPPRGTTLFENCSSRRICPRAREHPCRLSQGCRPRGQRGGTGCSGVRRRGACGYP